MVADGQRKTRTTPKARLSVSVLLARRHRQEPHQQPKQKQSADQREQGMQRVEMKVGIAIETIPRRQHETLLCTQGVPTGRLTTSIVPLFCLSGCGFFQSVVHHSNA